MSEQLPRLVRGPVLSTLAGRTGAMIWGMASMVAFNLVDTYFVSKLGTAELAAMSFTFPVVMVLGSVARGLGSGAMAAIAQVLGAGQVERARRIGTDGLLLSLGIVVVVVVLGLLTLDPVFTALGASPDALVLIRSYMIPWYWGVPFLVVPMVGNSMLRAVGEMRIPSVVMMAAMVLNVVLDPILIFGWGPVPAMGLEGAALATVAARALSMAVALWALVAKERLVDLSLPSPRGMIESSRLVLAVGIPASVTNMVFPAGMAVMTALVAVYGDAAVAAVGAATRVEMGAYMILMALGAVIGPFVGQNLGAGRMDRVRRGVDLSMGFALGWGLLMAALLAAFATPLGRVFSEDPQVIHYVVHYLYLVPLSFGLVGSLNLAGAALQVLDRSWLAFFLATLRVVAMVPLALLAGSWWQVDGVFGAISLAGLLAGAWGLVALYRALGRLGGAARAAT
ncbi:MAG: MATE family efflux transporter [Deltaproteobacteria bacterium]|nr:MATE family efflux transporter [Deltaproteobacteria bacterium]